MGPIPYLSLTFFFIRVITGFFLFLGINYNENIKECFDSFVKVRFCMNYPYLNKSTVHMGAKMSKKLWMTESCHHGLYK